MKLEIQTEKFKTIIGKVIKGSGRLNIFPKTTIIGITYADNTLTLTTTDRTNIVIIKETGVTNLTPEITSSYWAVDSDLLSKLVSKTTTQTITLEEVEGELIFRGNGKYSLPIILGDDSTVLKIDTSSLDNATFSEESTTTIPTKQLKSIIFFNKPSVAKTSESPHLTGYYFDEDSVITFNTVTACVNKVKVVKEKLLLPSSLVDLISILEGEETHLSICGNNIKVYSDNITIYSTLLENVDKYPSGALKRITEETFPALCTVSKDELTKALDRISLFILPNDDNSIRLTFNSNNVEIASKNGNSKEVVSFITSGNPIEFSELVDLQDLKNQLQTQLSEEITILYGSPRGLMIKTEEVYQLIPFMINE